MALIVHHSAIHPTLRDRAIELHASMNSTQVVLVETYTTVFAFRSLASLRVSLMS